MTTKQIHLENKRLQDIKSQLRDLYAEVFSRVNTGSDECNTLITLREDIKWTEERIITNWNLHG